MPSVTKVAVLLGLLFVSSLPSMAQTESATISGSITDASGAVVPEARVTVSSAETNVSLSTVTNRRGIYTFPTLHPGRYRLSVVKDGFRPVNLLDVIIHVQDSISQNFVLQPGSLLESITVTADLDNINTTDGAVSTVIDQSYVKNMPLNGRSLQDLVLLTPGVLTTSPQSGSGLGGSGEFSVNGQRTEENYYTVDGVSANVGMGAPGDSTALAAGVSGSLPGSTALGTTQGLANVDGLQEFRVQTSSYSAEYGHNPGAQIGLVTKSGTNRWHGGAFDYFRNGYFDAPDWFNDYYKINEPGVHQNDFGGTFGGPVRIPGLHDGKDKTFFFISYEGLRLSDPQPASTNTVPDAALRAAASPTVLPMLNAWPSPNGLDLGSGLAEYIASWSDPSSINSTSVRFDHTVGNKVNLFFRFSNTGSDSRIRPSGPNGQAASDPKSTTFALRTYTFGANTSFTNRLVNELRLNYTSNDVNQSWTTDGFGGAAPVKFAQFAGMTDGAYMIAGLYLGSYHTTLNEYSETSSQSQWNLVDTLTVASGHHGLKLGVDYRRLTSSVEYPSEGGGWDFFSQGDVQNNSPSFVQSFANAPIYPYFQNFALFAQDDWKISQHLTLSSGLRWEVNPPPGVTKGEKFWTMVNLNDPNAATLAPYGTPLWRTTWFNFAPRVGLAYLARSASGRETVMRIGGGVFFDSGQQLGAFFSGPGSNAYNFNNFLPGIYPQLPAVPVIAQPVPPYFDLSSAAGLTGYAPHLQLPYTLQWNASIQHAMGREQSVTVTYVGSHASRLLETNIVVPPNNPTLIANGAFDYLEINNGNTADYNSMQVQFQRKLSAGLTALASYTFSHCLDYGSSNQVFGYQRGNCDFDVRHNFSAAASYDVPLVGQKPVTKAILSHWGVDGRFIARTAFPVGVYGPQFLYPDGKLYDSGVNLVPGQAIYLYGTNCASYFQSIGGLAADQGCPGGRAINPQAFTSVNTGLGDAPRNFVRGFGAWQMTFAVRREFPLSERLKLQFRGEAFNVFNHPNFGQINSGWGGNTFGLTTATLANSLGTLSPRYQAGGPRSMQFALRLAF